LTRDPDKPSAKALLQYGSNIVLQKCDLNSQSSLTTALTGAYGFYCLTDYFSHRIEKVEDVTEEKEGRAMVEVAKLVGIKHLIWSTLPEIKESSGGTYQHVYHFDEKYRVEQYARTLGFEIASYVAPSCYMKNFTDQVSYVVCVPFCFLLIIHNRMEMGPLYLQCHSQAWMQCFLFAISNMIWVL
jgi:hypothetical protein